MGQADNLTLMEAVDNLSSMAELEVATPIPAKWLDPTKLEENQKTVKQTFKVLNNYLHHVYSKEKEQLKDIETQKGIQAIMVLAGEAAQKMDKFSSGLFKGVTELEEYKDLQQFYLTKIMRRFQEVLETEEAWEKEWGQIASSVLDIERRGLKDLETVRRDKEYELFFIKKEDENPFFNRNLLRHIRLVGDFDETIKGSGGDDPFLKAKVLQDKDVHAAAKEIIKLSLVHIDAFYKEAMRHKEITFVMSLNSALMALMLTANPRNLRENTTGKSSLSYFRDFQIFLRGALNSIEYEKYISTRPDPFAHTLINLSHSLCCFLFLRISSKKEATDFIHKLIQRGGKIINEKQPFWSLLLDEDESIRALLRQYPSGPLLKTLDIFREEEAKDGFDPLIQDNLPHQLFTFTYDSADITVLRIPSPTLQEIINKAEVVGEFKGYLRFLKGERHLLFNLQDRTSWQEHARCVALEEVQKQAEFSKSLTTVTLPKNTEFYTQAATYLDLNDAENFILTFKDQLASGEQCGFYFPPSINQKDLLEFTNAALKLVHNHFFAGRPTLARKVRLDFIEVFYLLLELKIIDLFKPDCCSFTCKDAIDVGAGNAAAFFSFLRMCTSEKEWTTEEKNLVLWILYSPALIIRERAVDPQNFNRTISVLAHIDATLSADRKKILSALTDLFGTPIFSTLKLEF